jgi:bifunctional NMN adenylyltransferase/nudix hydrolase
MTQVTIKSDSITITGNLNVTGIVTKTLQKKYNFAIYIGRFQPFHLGHLHVIQHALELADKLIIVIGSHNKPIDWKNPWTSAQRVEMIRDALTPEQNARVHFNTVEDRLYQNKEWEALVYDAVDSIMMDYSSLRVKGITEDRTAKCCVVGYDKDDSSFYLKSFPQWKLEQIPAFNVEQNDEALSATMIRDMLYHNRFGYVKSLLPVGAFDYVRNWLATEQAAYVKEWYDFDLKYQEPYESLKYGTNFYCADNVIFQSGHVLLIRRKSHPGKGLWALPGGHINNNETAFDASLRELEEETGLKIPEKVLIGSFQGEKIFDHPERSLRGRCGKKVGRTVSISHCYVLDDERGLPRVKAADDAEEVWWFPIAEVRKMRNELFEDHADQINYWLARVDDKKYR